MGAERRYSPEENRMAVRMLKIIRDPYARTMLKGGLQTIRKYHPPPDKGPVAALSLQQLAFLGQLIEADFHGLTFYFFNNRNLRYKTLYFDVLEHGSKVHGVSVTCFHDRSGPAEKFGFGIRKTERSQDPNAKPDKQFGLSVVLPAYDGDDISVLHEMDLRTFGDYFDDSTSNGYKYMPIEGVFGFHERAYVYKGMEIREDIRRNILGN